MNKPLAQEESSAAGHHKRAQAGIQKGFSTSFGKEVTLRSIEIPGHSFLTNVRRRQLQGNMEEVTRDFSIPFVEKIDLTGVIQQSPDDPPASSSGYNSALPSNAPKSTSSRGRWVGSDRSELQDIMSLDAVLGTTLFTSDQQNKSLEESGKTLMNQGKFTDAATLLEAVFPLTCRQQLMLAECYMYSGQRERIKDSIERAARLMTTSLRIRIQDLSAAIKKALAREDFVKALVLLHCSPRFAYLKLVPNDAVLFIERQVADYSHAVSAMAEVGGKIREYAEWFVTQHMLDILLLFREITKARYEKKIDCEARILTYFGLCYRNVGEHKRSLECFEQGLEVLSLSHDERLTSSRLYGILLHNAGLVYESLNDFAGAELHYVQAYEALSFANDFLSIKDKAKTVQVTENNLKLLRKRMDDASEMADAKSDSTDELLQE